MSAAFGDGRAYSGAGDGRTAARTPTCCTSCRYAVTGLSPTVWMADPPRYAVMVWNAEMPVFGFTWKLESSRPKSFAMVGGVCVCVGRCCWVE